MSRTLRFRVWDDGGKRWVEDAILGFASTGEGFGDDNRPWIFGLPRRFFFKSEGLVERDFAPEMVIEQWTGLKDRDDVDIYENDIVQFRDTLGHLDCGVVKWGEYGDGCMEEYVKGVQCWMVKDVPLSSIPSGGVKYGRGTETSAEIPLVISNVHQNPESLSK